MKETYLSRDFRETATQRFASQVKELNAFFDMRLNALRLKIFLFSWRNFFAAPAEIRRSSIHF